MKNDCRNITLADGFVHGELDSDERDRFMLHLEKCSECRSEVNHLRQLGKVLNAAYFSQLDETFNYRILKNLRKEELDEERKGIRIAFEDMAISFATLLMILILGLQLFDRPTVSPVEMVGALTNVERTSVEEQALSNDQVLEMVMRSK
jgi:anti-sigma factor RsiW